MMMLEYHWGPQLVALRCISTEMQYIMFYRQEKHI